MKNFFSALFGGISFLFWFLIVIFAGLGAVLVFAQSVKRFEVPLFLFYVFAVAVLLWGFGKLVLFKKRKELWYKWFPIMHYKYFVPLFIAFLIVFALSVSGSYFMILKTGADSTALELHSGSQENTVFVFFKALVTFTGIVLVWGNCLNLPFIGGKEYIKQLYLFFKRYLGVFVLYQAAFALITFVCNAIVLLMAQENEGSFLAMKGFFICITDAEGSGGLVDMALNGLSGLTAASTYFVLSSLAEESLDTVEELSFRSRLKRMLFDSDTRFLLIMTVLCTMSIFASNTVDEKYGYLFFAGCGLAWLVSGFLFLKQTVLLHYVLNFTILTLLEAAIPLPTLVGSGILLLVPAVLLRIILFAMAALLIAFDLHSAGKTLAAAAANPAQNSTINKVNKAIYNTSILSAGLKAADVVINRKKYARKAVNAVKDKVKEKITGEK